MQALRSIRNRDKRSQAAADLLLKTARPPRSANQTLLLLLLYSEHVFDQITSFLYTKISAIH